MEKNFNKIVTLLQKEYGNLGKHTVETIEGEKTKLFPVGHNSTHNFYLGQLEDGRWVKSSLGERGWDEENDTPVVSWNHRVLAADEEIGYIGHF